MEEDWTYCHECDMTFMNEQAFHIHKQEEHYQNADSGFGMTQQWRHQKQFGQHRPFGGPNRFGPSHQDRPFKFNGPSRFRAPPNDGLRSEVPSFIERFDGCPGGMQPNEPVNRDYGGPMRNEFDGMGNDQQLGNRSMDVVGEGHEQFGMYNEPHFGEQGNMLPRGHFKRQQSPRPLHGPGQFRSTLRPGQFRGQLQNRPFNPRPMINRGQRGRPGGPGRFNTNNPQNKESYDTQPNSTIPDIPSFPAQQNSNHPNMESMNTQQNSDENEGDLHGENLQEYATVGTEQEDGVDGGDDMEIDNSQAGSDVDIHVEDDVNVEYKEITPEEVAEQVSIDLDEKGFPYQQENILQADAMVAEEENPQEEESLQPTEIGEPEAELQAATTEEITAVDENAEEDWSFCKDCQLSLNSRQAYHVHMRGISHYNNTLGKTESDTEPTPKNAEPATPEPSATELTTKNPEPARPELSAASTVQPSAGTDVETASQDEGKDSNDEEEEDWSFCKDCQLSLNSKQAYYVHIRGISHYNNTLDSKSTVIPTKKYPQPVQPKSEEKQETNVQGSITMKLIGLSQQAIHREIDEEVAKLGDEYFCEVCRVTCSGIKPYKAHIDGKSHLKKLKNLSSLPGHLPAVSGLPQMENLELEVTLAKQKKRAIIQDLLDQETVPLLGVDYMTEFQKIGTGCDPRYICELCEAKMDKSQVVIHLTGTKHRRRYLKNHHFHYYNEVISERSKKEQRKLAEAFAKALTLKESYCKMRVRIEMLPSVGASQETKEQSVTEEELEIPGIRKKEDLPGIKNIEKYKEFQEIQDHDELDPDDPDPESANQNQAPNDQRDNSPGGIRGKEYLPKDRNLPDRHYPSRDRSNDYPPRDRDYPPRDKVYPPRDRDYPPQGKGFSPMYRGRGRGRERSPEHRASRRTRLEGGVETDPKKRSHSRDRERIRHRSRSKDRDRSRQRSRSLDRDRERSRSHSSSRDRSRRRSRSRSRDRGHSRYHSDRRDRGRGRSHRRSSSRSKDDVPKAYARDEREVSQDRDRKHKETDADFEEELRKLKAREQAAEKKEDTSDTEKYDHIDLTKDPDQGPRIDDRRDSNSGTPREGGQYLPSAERDYYPSNQNYPPREGDRDYPPRQGDRGYPPYVRDRGYPPREEERGYREEYPPPRDFYDRDYPPLRARDRDPWDYYPPRHYDPYRGYPPRDYYGRAMLPLRDPYRAYPPEPIRDPLAAKYEALARREHSGSPMSNQPEGEVRRGEHQVMPRNEADAQRREEVDSMPSQIKTAREGDGVRKHVLNQSKPVAVSASKPLVDAHYGIDPEPAQSSSDIDIPPPPPYHDPAYRDWYDTYVKPALMASEREKKAQKQREEAEKLGNPLPGAPPLPTEPPPDEESAVEKNSLAAIAAAFSKTAGLKLKVDTASGASPASHTQSSHHQGQMSRHQNQGHLQQQGHYQETATQQPVNPAYQQHVQPSTSQHSINTVYHQAYMEQKSADNMEAAIGQALHGGLSQSTGLDPFIIAQNVQKHLMEKGIALPQTQDAVKQHQRQQQSGQSERGLEQYDTQVDTARGNARQQVHHEQSKAAITSQQQQRTRSEGQTSRGYTDDGHPQPAKRKKTGSPSDGATVLTPELTGLLKEYVQKLEMSAKAEQKQSRKKGLFFTTKK